MNERLLEILHVDFLCLSDEEACAGGGALCPDNEAPLGVSDIGKASLFI